VDFAFAFTHGTLTTETTERSVDLTFADVFLDEIQIEQNISCRLYSKPRFDTFRWLLLGHGTTSHRTPGRCTSIKAQRRIQIR
jgi:hypothetical protein